MKKQTAQYPELNGDALLMANKEKWLGEIATQFNDYFVNAGNPLPKLRAVCGFPSNGARKPGAKLSVIGECWYPQSAGKEQHVEIFVTPQIDDPAIVVATLAHELCHAALGEGHGHGKEFGRLARGLDLQGPLTATVPGPKFLEMLDGFLGEVGEMPKGKLDVGDMKPAHPKTRKSQIKKSTMRCGKTDCEMEAIVKNNLIEDMPRLKCPVHGGDLLTKEEWENTGR